MFGTRKQMFESKERVVRQFLTGSTEGPIGMSEEKDAATGGPATDGAAARRRKIA
jgi:phospholipid/cholesterol/gamma-HCH transport system ATP-binding protein